MLRHERGDGGSDGASAATLGATLDIQVFAESNALRESGFGSLIFPVCFRTFRYADIVISSVCSQGGSPSGGECKSKQEWSPSTSDVCATCARGCPFFASSAMSSRADRRKFSNGFLSY